MYSQMPFTNCDQIIGPEEPEYDECSFTTTTSSTTTATSTTTPLTTTTTTTITTTKTTPTTTTTHEFHPSKAKLAYLICGSVS